MRGFLVALILAGLSLLVAAQNATTTITTTVPVSTISRVVSTSGRVSTSFSTVLATRTTVSVFPTATASELPDPSKVTLDTKIGPAFGVLGAVLILTGLPSAFWGHKNRWSSFFIIGFYTLAVVCVVLILRFGVLQAINPPSETIRGLFVLSCAVAGVIGGGIAIFFWKGTKYFIGAWGGFAVGLFIQCLHDGGLIKPIGFRWILFIGCAVIGFVVCTIPKWHYHVLLAATAVVGATAFILGVDCYTTAGLKEFYVYNLGFRALFPKYAEKDFPVSQTMQIELGMIGAVTIMGMAVQARVLVALQAKLREINAEQERRNAEVEAKAAARFDTVNRELEEWEREHGKGSRNPNKDDLEASRTQTPESPRASSQFSFFKSSHNHTKRRSSITMADLAKSNQNTPKEEPVGPKINLDLGESVEKAIPEDLKAAEGNIRLSEEEQKDGDLVQKMSLLNEIQGIRNTINALRSDGARPSSFSGASSNKNVASSGTTQPRPGQRSPGRASTRPLSQFDSLGTGSGLGIQEDRIQRPTSTPALTEWDNYVRSRNLFQPPSGVSAPITPTPIQNPRPQSISVPLAVAEAIEQRKKQEKAYELGGPDAYIEAAAGGSSGRQSRPSSVMFGNGASDEDQPLSHRRRTSSHSLLQGSSRPRTNSQVLILPPQRSSPSPSPNQPIVRTFEELESRHKEKIKALQDPLTKKEREEAEITAARKRWERSVQVERNVMTRKEQEQVPEKREGHAWSSSRPHSRSLSGFTLQGQDTSRPLSNISKVQEWKRYQDATQQQTTTEQSSSNPGHQRSRSKSPHGLLSGSHSSRPHSQSFGRTDAIV
ncbi:hypothetical protein CPB86DRAFT_778177 [Serendipita vermifera]|nr:hypothetical protein CPB86DRAFT_778177 [Serendipita vermifera]